MKTKGYPDWVEDEREGIGSTLWDFLYFKIACFYQGYVSVMVKYLCTLS
jgi:hypothetical protein